MIEMLISTRKDVIAVAIAGAALLTAVIIFFAAGSGGGSGNPDFPEGHAFVCSDCGEATILSDRELFSLKVKARESDDPEAGRVVCKACGSQNTRPALKCPNCGHYFAREGGGRPVCPSCNRPFPSRFGGD
jgi:hypothetical protein